MAGTRFLLLAAGPPLAAGEEWRSGYAAKACVRVEYTLESYEQFIPVTIGDASAAIVNSKPVRQFELRFRPAGGAQVPALQNSAVSFGGGTPGLRQAELGPDPRTGEQLGALARNELRACRRHAYSSGPRSVQGAMGFGGTLSAYLWALREAGLTQDDVATMRPDLDYDQAVKTYRDRRNEYRDRPRPLRVRSWECALARTGNCRSEVRLCRRAGRLPTANRMTAPLVYSWHILLRGRPRGGSAFASQTRADTAGAVRHNRKGNP